MSRFVQFIETLRNYSEQPCIEDDGTLHLYSDLLNEFRRWQLRFDQFNVEVGTVIGVRADYSLTAVAALLALLWRGAVAALIPRDRASARYLVDARAAALLEVSVNGHYEWQARSQSATHPLLEALRDTGQGGLILFTSGSTGHPKAALQSAERLLHKFSKPGRRFRTLAFLLFDHIAGIDTLLHTFMSGGTLILTRRRDPRSILELIKLYKVEVLPTSPSFLRLLCATAGGQEHRLPDLKIITYGSEPMDPSTLFKLSKLFPDVSISQKYGTTETGSPKSISRADDSLWLKFNKDGVETKVIEGVLWIRSEGTILGYLNAPSPIDDEGWFCTADLVDVDGEWLTFRGRATDIINVGGEKVSPAEVEHSILELDFVREAVVSGEPHLLMGQVVTARVVLAATDMDPKEAVRRIWQHCRRRLASYKAPVKVDITSDGFTDERQKVRRK